MKLKGTGLRFGWRFLLSEQACSQCRRCSRRKRLQAYRAFDIFRARLAENGYVEGKNLVFEQRFADCRYDRMPSLAVELARVPVDVLFTMRR